MGCTFISFILGLFNLILLAGGSAVIWVGYMVVYESKKLFTVILPKLSDSLKVFELAGQNQNVMDDASKILDSKLGLAILIVGVIIVIISFFGLISAVCQIALFEIPYVILLSVLLIASITLTCIFGARSDLVRDTFAKVQYKLFSEDYKFGDSTGFTKLWDITQKDLQCCGVYDFKDYVKASLVTGGQSVPESCCKTPGCGPKPSMENAFIDFGCEAKIWDFVVLKYREVVIGMAVVDIIIFIPLVFVLVLICKFKRA